jgi:quercetin dioxygenase-like cupin family protein
VSWAVWHDQHEYDTLLYFSGPNQFEKGNVSMPASSDDPYLTSRPPPTLTRGSGATVTILVSSADSGGAIGMIETVFPPGSPALPMHIHSREDETFYVVSGTGEFRLGEATLIRGPGSRIFGPRDVPHTFRNVGDTDLKCLIVYSPGGFEQSFIDIAALGEAGADLRATGVVLQGYGLTRV